MRQLWFVLMTSALTAGCSALVGSDNSQCERHADCDSRFGPEQNYSCESNFCVQRTCATAADCAAWGAEFAEHQCLEGQCQADPKWACLGSSPVTAEGLGPFRVKLQLRNIINQMPLSGVAAALCRKLDVNCENPERTYVSDESGDLYLDVPLGFSGYVSLTRDDLMPTLYFFNPPVTRDQELPALPLGPPAVTLAITQQAGIEQSPERGLVLLGALDCSDSMTAGVSYSSDGDASTVTFYSVRSLPSTTARATDASGFGGFLNALPGALSLTGRRESDQRVVGTISVLVKAGAITSSRISPLSP